LAVLFDMGGCSERYYFSFVRFDKAQSKSGGWRVPEVVSHGLALAADFLVVGPDGRYSDIRLKREYLCLF